MMGLWLTGLLLSSLSGLVVVQGYSTYTAVYIDPSGKVPVGTAQPSESASLCGLLCEDKTSGFCQFNANDKTCLLLQVAAGAEHTLQATQANTEAVLLRSTPGEPSEWTKWSTCTETCDSGTHTRSRTCVAPHPHRENNCPETLSETEACNTNPCPPDILLILGGYNERSVDMMTTNNQPADCDIEPAFPPGATSGFPTWFKIDGDPVFCEDNGKCHKYSPGSNSWTGLGKRLSNDEYHAVAVELDKYWLITGGTKSGHVINTSLYWDTDTGDFAAGPDLPYATSSHCIVSINGTHAFLAGGSLSSGFSASAYILDSRTDTWTQLDSMNTERKLHTCGVVEGTKVFVVGGYTTQRLSSVEIFDLETNQWSDGPDFSGGNSAATAVQLKDTFLIVGGVSPDGETLKTVWEYDLDTNNWAERTHKMERSRNYSPAVFKLPPQYLHCT